MHAKSINLYFYARVTFSVLKRGGLFLFYFVSRFTKEGSGLIIFLTPPVFFWLRQFNFSCDLTLKYQSYSGGYMGEIRPKYGNITLVTIVQYTSLKLEGRYKMHIKKYFLIKCNIRYGIYWNETNIVYS